MDQDSASLDAIAAEAAEALINTQQISPFSSRPKGLTIDDAYRVTPRVRKIYHARGSKVVGRKIGFTNRTIWDQYGVYQPIWGYVFDETAKVLAETETLALRAFSEPRIEPEILFGLGSAPSADMDERALAGQRGARRVEMEDMRAPGGLGPEDGRIENHPVSLSSLGSQSDRSGM